jgi:hypothetical protein
MADYLFYSLAGFATVFQFLLDLFLLLLVLPLLIRAGTHHGLFFPGEYSLQESGLFRLRFGHPWPCGVTGFNTLLEISLLTPKKAFFCHVTAPGSLN